MKKIFLILIVVFTQISFLSCNKYELAQGPFEIEEPILKFGASRLDIKSEENRTLVKETSTMLKYKGEGYTDHVIYRFNEKGNTGMSSAEMKIHASAYLFEFLVARYDPVPKRWEGSYFLYLSGDGKVVVRLDAPVQEYWKITYVKFSDFIKKNKL